MAQPPDNPDLSGSHQPPVSQKSMTKAQRRELQEKQRAAKQAAAPGPTTSKATPKHAAPSTPASKRLSGQFKSQLPPSLTKDTSKDASSQSGQTTRGLRIFAHFGLPKQASHVVKGDIHPSIVRLALQFSEFKICGANARCIATLTAFKTVIQDYVTPPNNTLSRHLMTHLSPQITHLVNARPMSVTMGNAIRELKLEISGSDIDLPEQDAKDALCIKIDNYIRDRVIIADQVIQDIAGNKIKDGDVVLTYARSSVVEKVILGAREDGKKFSVIVIDSRPLLEGKAFLPVFTSHSIPTTYALLPSLPSLLSSSPPSLVLLGAHSISSNGSVFSRAGTALVAMMAKQHSIPVVVCCETYKFSEGVMLDGFGRNELAPVGSLLSSFPLSRPKSSLTLESQPNLEILNPLYDLTPPTSITAVVTEVGVIPPSSISSIPLALGRQTL